jgi:hypothetical protein
MDYQIILGKASTVADLNRKMKAAEVLTDGKFSVYATGDFVTSESEIVFMRPSMEAEVVKVGRKYATLKLDDGSTVDAYPATDSSPLWKSEFIIYKD